MNWLLYSILSAILYAIAEIISKYVSDKKSEPVFIGIIAAGFTTVTMFQFASFEKLQLPTELWPYVGAIIAALLYAIGIITYYEALKQSDISEFALLSRSRVLPVVLGGILLFREQFNLLQIIGGICVIYAVFLLTYEGGKLKFSKGMLFALGTALLFAIGSLFDKAVIDSFTPAVYTFIDYLLVVAFLFPLAFQRFLDGVKLPRRKTIGILFVVGLFYGLSAYCIYSAYLVKGPVSLVSLASQFEIIITVFWGILILKERKRLWSKIFSMFMLMAGVMMLR